MTETITISNQNETLTAKLDTSSFPLVPSAPVPSNGKTICLVGAKDAQHASYDDLCAVPVPEATFRNDTGNVAYLPVKYSDFADATRSIFAQRLNAEPISECYALAREGQQMFGRIVFPWGEDARRGLQVCLRSSYDRTIANQVAAGLSTFICANGMLDGEAMISLKHTAEVGTRLPRMIQEMAQRAGNVAQKMQDRLSSWEEVEMGDDLFFAYVGILRGRGIITPTIESAAINYWKACRSGNLHAEHSDPNLVNAYQAVSGGLHRVPPMRAFASFGGVDAITQGVAQSGGSLTGIPSFSLDIEEF